MSTLHLSLFQGLLCSCFPTPAVHFQPWSILYFVVYAEFPLLLFAVSVSPACFSGLYLGVQVYEQHIKPIIYQSSFKVRLNFSRKRSKPL